MKFGRIVLQVNAHRLMESDFDTASYVKDGAMTAYRVRPPHMQLRPPAAR